MVVKDNPSVNLKIYYPDPFRKNFIAGCFKTPVMNEGKSRGVTWVSRLGGLAKFARQKGVVFNLPDERAWYNFVFYVQ